MYRGFYLPSIPIDTRYLASLSVRPDEVCATVLRKGELLDCKGEAHSYDGDVALIVDRLRQRDDGTWTCTMIRQVLPIADDQWGQEWVDPCPPLREAAKKLEAKRVKVPGGIPPLTLDGTVAVPDFALSGTNWYIVGKALARCATARGTGKARTIESLMERTKER